MTWKLTPDSFRRGGPSPSFPSLSTYGSSSPTSFLNVSEPCKIGRAASAQRRRLPSLIKDFRRFWKAAERLVQDVPVGLLDSVLSDSYEFLEQRSHVVDDDKR